MTDKLERVRGSRDAEGYLLRREQLAKEMRKKRLMTHTHKWIKREKDWKDNDWYLCETCRMLARIDNYGHVWRG